MAMCQPAVVVSVTNLLSLLLPPWSKPHLCAAIVWKRKLLLPIASVIPVMFQNAQRLKCKLVGSPIHVSGYAGNMDPFCFGNVFIQLNTCPLPPSYMQSHYFAYMLPNIFPQLQIWGLDFYMFPKCQELGHVNVFFFNASQNKKGPKILRYLTKKQSFYKKKDFFFLGTFKFFGPSYFMKAFTIWHNSQRWPFLL